MNTESGPRAPRLLVSSSRRQKPIGVPTSKHHTEESGQLSLGERTGAGIAINAAWHGAALVQTPENPRRVIGLFNMAAVGLIGSLIGVHWSLTLFALSSWPARW